MICNRHGCIATNAEYGLWMCLRCFREAITKAEDILLEAKLAAMRSPVAFRMSHESPLARYTTVDELMRRLGGTR